MGSPLRWRAVASTIVSPKCPRSAADSLLGPSPACALQEDRKLLQLIDQHGRDNWSKVADAMEQCGMPGRTGKSCRLR